LIIQLSIDNRRAKTRLYRFCNILILCIATICIFIFWVRLCDGLAGGLEDVPGELSLVVSGW